MTLVEFDVVGIPAPQGSKKAFVANGRAIVKEAGGTHALWRNQVAQAAKDFTMVMAANGGYHAPFDGALGLTIELLFPMPKSRTKAQRDSGRIFKTTAPDLDKLVRNICDALQAGGLVVDDARFARIVCTKHEVVGWTGARISIERLR